MDAEELLKPEVRAALPLSRQIGLYVNPWSFFKDCTKGKPQDQVRALSYNRAHRNFLLPYINRWGIVAATSFISLSPIDVMTRDGFLYPIVAAGAGLFCAVSVVVVVITAYTYTQLTSE